MMCRYTGRYIEDETEQVKAAIEDILTTRKGSRVLNREYGCELFDYMDGSGSKIDIYRSIVEAISKYEPRLKLTNTQIHTDADGKLHLRLSGDIELDGSQMAVNKLVNHQMVLDISKSKSKA